MSKILVINLISKESIVRCLDVIKSLNLQNPDNEIFLLTKDDFSVAAKITHLLAGAFSINDKKIKELINNTLIPDAMALDNFVECINDVIDNKWDTVINIGNCEISKHLTSLVASKDNALVIGPSAGAIATQIMSDVWTTLIHDQLTHYFTSPIESTDAHIKALKLREWFKTSKDNLKINNKFTSKTFNAFKTIRDANGANCRIIGIELKGENEYNNLSFDNTCHLINVLLDDVTIYPVLLISPKDEERVYAREINKKFGNCLVIIEADGHALPSITINLDALISTGGMALAISSITETPSLELLLSTSSNLPFKTNRKDGICLKINPSYSNISQSIYGALRILLGNTSIFTSSCDTIYRSSEDSFGQYYKWIGGKINADEILNYTMSRFFMSKFSISSLSLKSIVEELPVELNDLIIWTKKQRKVATDVTKDLLGTLRTLLLVQKNSTSGQDFALSLSKLLSHTHDRTLTDIPTTLFANRIESMEGENFTNNFKMVERALYQFKDEVQIIVNQIKSLEQITLSVINENRIRKSLTNNLTQ